MRKKKQNQGPAGAPGWMTSFADMMCAMFVFFVLLFAMSDIQEDQFAAFLAAFGNPFIAPPQPTTAMSFDSVVGTGLIQMPTPTVAGDPATESPEEFDQTHQALQSMTLDFITYFTESQNPLSADVNVQLVDDQLIITFGENMLFASGSAILLPATLEMLDYVASVLSLYEDFDIHIVGHTDSDAINTVQFQSNWELGFGRAMAVHRHFVGAESYIDELRVFPTSRGEVEPIASNDTPEGRSANRRVEIIIQATE